MYIEERKNVHITKGFERQEEDFRYSIIGNCGQFMILWQMNCMIKSCLRKMSVGRVYWKHLTKMTLQSSKAGKRFTCHNI